ncbi:MAG: hypothetical protein MJZ16_07765 [Bacteroidales bacterium]|nr:hypothetical protein [Bacteroidales bacterium]
MAYRKYDTCFFERYAMLSLKTILGHKFDDLVNYDRPDLQSSDGKRLGIEVTRAMDGGKKSAQKMLKDMAGITPQSDAEKAELQEIISNGYAYGLQEGKYIGGVEFNYWQTAKPLREIIQNKVGKVSSGFYGSFEEFGLYIFCKDTLSEENVASATRYIMSLQKDLDVKYDRMYLCGPKSLHACNLADDLSFEYRISSFAIDQPTRKRFFLESLDLKGE